MSLPNTPITQICYDDARIAKIKFTGYYTTGNTLNVSFQANTLFGANVAASAANILDILQIEGNVDLTNGTELFHLQFVSTGNQNTDILVVGGPGNAVFMDGYIPNNANTPTGDLNIWLNGGKAGDCWSLMVTVAKNNQGVLAGNSGGQQWYGIGNWGSGYVNT